MPTILLQMLANYKTANLKEMKNALKEIVQEIALSGLARAGFFKHAAFYGGTALRIFYHLDRFSEDLDFSLINPQLDFSWDKYFPSVEQELAAHGLKFSVSAKKKTASSPIKEASLKGNLRKHIMQVFNLSNPSINPEEVLKIKIELDTNPPPGANFENKLHLLPSPHQVKLYDPPSLFAGKVHAVICRAWKSRIKGRDLYDYVFYLAHKIPLNLPHLRARLEKSGVIDPAATFGQDELKALLNQRFKEIDFAAAKQDVLPFIDHPHAIDLWDAKFFTSITQDLQIAKNNH